MQRQHFNVGLYCDRSLSTSGIFLAFITMPIPANTKKLYNSYRMLDQRRRRLADVVYMLYNCFVFTGLQPIRGPYYVHTGTYKSKSIQSQ